MKKSEAEQLWGEIENQGFGYWVQHYGYKGKDKLLEGLCLRAKLVINELDAYIQEIWDKHNIG